MGCAPILLSKEFDGVLRDSANDIAIVGAVAQFYQIHGIWPTSVEQLKEDKTGKNDFLSDVSSLSSDPGSCTISIKSSRTSTVKLPDRKVLVTLVEKTSRNVYKSHYVSDPTSGVKLNSDITIEIDNKK